MNFASDNAGPVHPKVMQALVEANAGHALPYGNDSWTALARDRVRDVLEAPEAAVYFVSTGTAANVLALSSLTRPWDTVFCTPVAHVEEDECNAPEFYTGGAKLTLVGEDDLMPAEALEAAMAKYAGSSVHNAQCGPVTLTQVTENGRVYAPGDIAALCEVAHGYGSAVHLDGARLANAVAALGCTPAEVTWKAGVDVLSFGGTKNGLMAVEAVVFFDPARAAEFELRRKRGAHLFSKHRFLAAQMAAYLEDGLWLEMAAQANAKAARLVEGLRGAGVELLWEPQANMVFCTLPRGVHRRVQAAGAAYSVSGSLEGAAEEPVAARLVCDWSVTEEAIERFVSVIAEGC